MAKAVATRLRLNCSLERFYTPRVEEYTRYLLASDYTREEVEVAMEEVRVKGREEGKNSIYHLLNKIFKKYVKGLVNKNWVKEIVNPVLPSQTPTSIPWRFR